MYQLKGTNSLVDIESRKLLNVASCKAIIFCISLMLVTFLTDQTRLEN